MENIMLRPLHPALPPLVSLLVVSIEHPQWVASYCFPHEMANIGLVGHGGGSDLCTRDHLVLFCRVSLKIAWVRLLHSANEA